MIPPIPPFLRLRLKRVGVHIDRAHQLAGDLRLEVETPVFLNGGRFDGPGTEVRRVGRYSYFRSGSRLVSFASIGRFCSIARNVRIGDPDHPLDWVSTHPFTYNPSYTGKRGCMKDASACIAKPVVIGHDVWIGVNAVVRGGVTIGHGAVVGANAVVTKDVKPYEIVGGVPARHIRFRFPEETVQQLLELNWWDYDPTDLVELDCDRVEGFMAQFRAGGLRPLTPRTYLVERRGAVLRLIEPDRSPENNV